MTDHTSVVSEDGHLEIDIPSTRFRLFRNFASVEATAATPAAQDVYATIGKLRDAVRAGSPSWTAYSTFRDYADICFWAIRKLEYGFAAEAFAAIERQTNRPLQVLDVGCGVVPFCNWASGRGHKVIGIDPSEADLDFLVQNRLNAFYDSSVEYEVGRAEQLRFPDEMFDVVTCISVLEHIPPGNDRVALWEMARVLKPGGHLIITFDISPPAVSQPGDQPWPAHLRRFAHPFSPVAAQQLLQSAALGFDVSPVALPNELQRLSWDDVYQFWQASQEHDGRADPIREYLAIGGVLQRRDQPVSITSEQIVAGYFEGQAALEERLHFFEAHATERLALVQRLDEQASLLRTQVDEKEQVITGLQTAANERLALIEELHGEIHARLANVEASLTQLAEVVSANLTVAAEAELRALRAEKELAESTSRARLEVIDQQRRAIEAFNRRSPALQRVRRALQPRIGVLYHYPPRTLVIPTWYRKTRPPTPAPKISVVTPTLNQGRFIERTLKSVLDQEYPSLEYIVQDGGSTDDTHALLSAHEDRLACIASEPDRGMADAINKGFSHATGDVLAYLNSDDLLLPGALNYVARYFAAHPEVDVVYGHRVVIDEYDAEIARWVLPPHDNAVLSWADYVPQETLFWRRSMWERVGGAVDDTFLFAVDWDLLLRFREAGASMRRLPRFLGAFRVHPHQKTSAEMEDLGAREMARLRERCHGHAVTPHDINLGIRGYLRRHTIYHKLYRLGVLRY